MLKSFVYSFLSTMIITANISVYDGFCGFYNGMYIMEKDNETILVDEENNIIKNFNFLETDGFSLTDDSYLFQIEEKTYINKPTKAMNGYVYDNNNIYTNTAIEDEKSEFKIDIKVVKDGEKYGVEKDDKIIIPLNEGELFLMDSNTIRRGNEMSTDANELYDINGKQLLSKKDNYNVFAVYEDEILVRDIVTGKFGIISKNKEEKISLKYDFLYKPNKDLNVYYIKKNKKDGLIINGREMYKNFKFDVYEVWDNGYIYCELTDKENTCAILSPDGRLLFFVKGKIRFINNNSFIIQREDGKIAVTSL